MNITRGKLDVIVDCHNNAFLKRLAALMEKMTKLLTETATMMSNEIDELKVAGNDSGSREMKGT